VITIEFSSGKGFALFPLTRPKSNTLKREGSVKSVLFSEIFCPHTYKLSKNNYRPFLPFLLPGAICFLLLFQSGHL
jgi:hypothetical protein